MGHTLEQFAAKMHDILAAEPGPAGREKVRALVEEVLKDEAFVARHLGDDVPERKILFEDPQLGFCILAHVYKGARESNPHDHGPTWAIYGQARGETLMNDWALVEPASEAKPGKVRHVRSYPLKPGMAHVYNEGDLHSPRRDGPTRLIRIEGTEHGQGQAAGLRQGLREQEARAMKDNLRFVDSDMHIMEPPDLFERYLDPKFRDRVILPDRRRRPAQARHDRHRRAAHHDGRRAAAVPQAQPRRAGEHAQHAAALRLAAAPTPDRLDFAIERELRPRGAGDGHGDGGRRHRGALPDHRPEPARPRQHGPAALAGPLPGLQQLDPRVLPATAPSGSSSWRCCRCTTCTWPAASCVRCVRELGAVGSFIRPNLVNGHYWHSNYWDPLYTPARGARRHLGLPRGHRRLVLAHERALRREPLLPPRGQPLDRDAAGADRDDHRRRVRVPSQAARRLPRGAELLGARAPVAHRVGLPAVPRHPRALPHPDARRSTSGATAGPRWRAASRRSRRPPA